MESLEISLVHKAFVSQSKAILLFFLALLLLMLAFLHMETLMPTIWHACTGFFELGPVFAFLLLNCLIVTIIASTKLESHEKGGHEEAIKRESMREGDEKGLFIAENAIRRGIIAGQSHNSSIYGYDTNEGKDFAGSSCCISLNANYKDQIIKQEPINVSEKKPSYRVEYCTRSDEVGLLPNYYKPTSDSKEKKLMRCSFSFNDDRATGFEKCQKTNGRHAGNVNIIDHQSGQGKEPAAAAAMTHPSLEEAWAAIMSTKKNDDRMVAKYMQPADQCIKGSVNYENDNQAAAARTPPAAATNTPRPPAAAAANPLISAQADVPIKPPGGPSTDAPATAIGKQELYADDHEHDSELEELNRRAEEFIARFNNQMRLQRQESLQRRKGRHRRSTCNHHHIQYSNRLQLPPPGLLVG